jgi:hypothetical protein
MAARPERFAIPQLADANPSLGEDETSALLTGTDRGIVRFLNGRVEARP